MKHIFTVPETVARTEQSIVEGRLLQVSRVDIFMKRISFLYLNFFLNYFWEGQGCNLRLKQFFTETFKGSVREK